MICDVLEPGVEGYLLIMVSVGRSVSLLRCPEPRELVLVGHPVLRLGVMAGLMGKDSLSGSLVFREQVKWRGEGDERKGDVLLLVGHLLAVGVKEGLVLLCVVLAYP